MFFSALNFEIETILPLQFDFVLYNKKYSVSSLCVILKRKPAQTEEQQVKTLSPLR